MTSLPEGNKQNSVTQSEQQTPATSSILRWRPRHLPQIELFQGTAVTHPSRQYLALDYIVGVSSSGEATFQTRKERYSGKTSGLAGVIEPGEAWTSQVEGYSFLCVFIDPALLRQVASEIADREKPWPHFFHDLFIDASVCRTLRDLSAITRSPASRLQQEERLLHTLVQLLLRHTQQPGEPRRLGWEQPSIKRVKTYLEEHYAEEISLQDLATVANLSTFHLARLFRQAVGLPPHAYQTQIRLARARTLLAHGLPVSSVASETGFFDQAHFTQQFKRYFFVTPGTYQKTARFSKTMTIFR